MSSHEVSSYVSALSTHNWFCRATHGTPPERKYSKLLKAINLSLLWSEERSYFCESLFCLMALSLSFAWFATAAYWALWLRLVATVTS